MSKPDNERARAMARRILERKGIYTPSKIQIDYVAELTKPESFADFLSKGLKARKRQLPKVDESR